MSVISIEKILNRARELEKGKEEVLEINIKSLGGSIKVKKISRMEYFDILNSESEDKDAETIYNACIDPKLSSDEILATLSCTENPESVVNKIFTHAEKTSIVELILEESGILGKNLISKVVEDIKK